MNKHWFATRLLPIFLVLVLVLGGIVYAVPSFRAKFTGFLKYFGPKADTGAVIIGDVNRTSSPSPSSTQPTPDCANNGFRRGNDPEETNPSPDFSYIVTYTEEGGETWRVLTEKPKNYPTPSSPNWGCGYMVSGQNFKWSGLGGEVYQQQPMEQKGYCDSCACVPYEGEKCRPLVAVTDELGWNVTGYRPMTQEEMNRGVAANEWGPGTCYKSMMARTITFNESMYAYFKKDWDQYGSLADHDKCQYLTPRDTNTNQPKAISDFKVAINLLGNLDGHPTGIELTAKPSGADGSQATTQAEPITATNTVDEQGNPWLHERDRQGNVYNTIPKITFQPTKEGIYKLQASFTENAQIGILLNVTTVGYKAYDTTRANQNDEIAQDRTSLDRPVQDLSTANYTNTDYQEFGASRDDGRIHMGVDIHAPYGTDVRAIADGDIVGFRQFVNNTNIIIVRHTINGQVYYAGYGEVQPGSLQTAGINGTPSESNPIHISRGQSIGQVGDNGRSDPMLHFEMYSSYPGTENWSAGSQRPSWLVDPTLILNQAYQIGSDITMNANEEKIINLKRMMTAQFEQSGQTETKFLGDAYFQDRSHDLPGNSRVKIQYLDDQNNPINPTGQTPKVYYTVGQVTNDQLQRDNFSIPENNESLLTTDFKTLPFTNQQSFLKIKAKGPTKFKLIFQDEGNLGEEGLYKKEIKVDVNSLEMSAGTCAQTASRTMGSSNSILYSTSASTSSQDQQSSLPTPAINIFSSAHAAENNTGSSSQTESCQSLNPESEGENNIELPFQQSVNSTSSSSDSATTFLNIPKASAAESTNNLLFILTAHLDDLRNLLANNRNNVKIILESSEPIASAGDSSRKISAMIGTLNATGTILTIDVNEGSNLVDQDGNVRVPLQINQPLADAHFTLYAKVNNNQTKKFRVNLATQTLNRPEITIKKIDGVNYYPTANENDRPKAYPGSTIEYEIKYTNNSSSFISDFDFGSVLPIGVVENAVSIEQDIPFTYNREIGLAYWHITDRINSGQIISKTMQVKYNNEIPFKIDITDTGQADLKTFNVAAFIKKHFGNTNSDNYNLSTIVKSDIWQIIKGTITGPYGHPVPGLNIAVATGRTTENASLAINAIGGDVIVSGIDLHAEQSMNINDSIISSENGSYEIPFKRGKLDNHDQLKIIVYFKNILSEYASDGQITHPIKVSYYYYSVGNDLLYWKVPIDLVERTSTLVSNPKIKTIEQNININPRNGSSPQPEYPTISNGSELVAQTATSAESQYWLYHAKNVINGIINHIGDMNDNIVNVTYNDHSYSEAEHPSTILMGYYAWHLPISYKPHPLLHEYSHLIHNQLGPPDRRGDTNHDGYINPNSSDSYYEGFAGFLGMYLYNSINGSNDYDNFYDSDGVILTSYTNLLPVFHEVSNTNSSGVVKRVSEERAITIFMKKLLDNNSIEFVLNIMKDKKPQNFSEFYKAIKDSGAMTDTISNLAKQLGFFVDSNGNWLYNEGETVGSPANKADFLALPGGIPIGSRLTRKNTAIPNTAIKISSKGGGINLENDQDLASGRKFTTYRTGVINNQTNQIDNQDYAQTIELINDSNIYAPEFLDSDYSFFIFSNNSPDYYLIDSSELEEIQSKNVDFANIAEANFRTAGNCDEQKSKNEEFVQSMEKDLKEAKRAPSEIEEVTKQLKSQQESDYNECLKTNEELQGQKALTIDDILAINKDKQDKKKQAQLTPEIQKIEDQQAQIAQETQDTCQAMVDINNNEYNKKKDSGASEEEFKKLQEGNTRRESDCFSGKQQQSALLQVDKEQIQQNITNGQIDQQKDPQGNPVVTQEMQDSRNQIQQNQFQEQKTNIENPSQTPEYSDNQISKAANLVVKLEDISSNCQKSVQESDVKFFTDNTNLIQTVPDFSFENSTKPQAESWPQALKEKITEHNQEIQKIQSLCQTKYLQSSQDLQNLKDDKDQVTLSQFIPNLTVQAELLYNKTYNWVMGTDQKPTTPEALIQKNPDSPEARQATVEEQIKNLDFIPLPPEPFQAEDYRFSGMELPSQTSTSNTSQPTSFLNFLIAKVQAADASTTDATAKTEIYFTNLSNAQKDQQISQALPGQTIVVNAQGFSQSKNLQIFLDNQYLEDAKIASPSFALKIKMPIDLKSGEHTVKLIGDGKGEFAVKTITITKPRSFNFTYLWWGVGIVITALIIFMIAKARRDKLETQQNIS